MLFMYYYEEYSSFLARLQWQEASLYGPNFYMDMNPAQWILMTVICSDFSSSAILTLTLVIWGEMSWQLLDLICSDIYSMFPPLNNFFNPLIFHPVPSPAHHISNLSKVYEPKPATFPSASQSQDIFYNTCTRDDSGLHTVLLLI